MVSALVELLDKLCAKPIVALGPLCGDLYPEDLQMPFSSDVLLEKLNCNLSSALYHPQGIG